MSSVGNVGIYIRYTALIADVIQNLYINSIAESGRTLEKFNCSQACDETFYGIAYVDKIYIPIQSYPGNPS